NGSGAPTGAMSGRASGTRRIGTLRPAQSLGLRPDLRIRMQASPGIPFHNGGWKLAEGGSLEGPSPGHTLPAPSGPPPICHTIPIEGEIEHLFAHPPVEGLGPPRGPCQEDHRDIADLVLFREGAESGIGQL